MFRVSEPDRFQDGDVQEGDGFKYRKEAETSMTMSSYSPCLAVPYTVIYPQTVF